MMLDRLASAQLVVFPGDPLINTISGFNLCAAESPSDGGSSDGGAGGSGGAVAGAEEKNGGIRGSRPSGTSGPALALPFGQE